MDWGSELAHINHKIAKAIDEGKEDVLDSLNDMKKGVERQLQLGQLSRELAHDTQDYVEDAKRSLQNKQHRFEDLDHRASDIQAQLSKSFESHAGSIASQELANTRLKIYRDLQDDYEEIIKSCQVHFF
ncbi:hypothetical protein [Listeria sp. ILCC792]|uniref:hypothetical protein n=1 Tax=Listeria sp. ILCC792 TaxID=1918331 RepID=UPI000B5873DA|nr:hypothetical protein [Listeria sp. ILCC792]